MINSRWLADRTNLRRRLPDGPAIASARALAGGHDDAAVARSFYRERWKTTIGPCRPMACAPMRRCTTRPPKDSQTAGLHERPVRLTYDLHLDLPCIATGVRHIYPTTQAPHDSPCTPPPHQHSLPPPTPPTADPGSHLQRLRRTPPAPHDACGKIKNKLSGQWEPVEAIDTRNPVATQHTSR